MSFVFKPDDILGAVSMMLNDTGYDVFHYPGSPNWLYGELPDTGKRFAIFLVGDTMFVRRNNAANSAEGVGYLECNPRSRQKIEEQMVRGKSGIALTDPHCLEKIIRRVERLYGIGGTKPRAAPRG